MQKCNLHYIQVRCNLMPKVIECVLSESLKPHKCNGDIETVCILTERQVFIWERACFENNMDQQTEYFCSGVQREERAG